MAGDGAAVEELLLGGRELEAADGAVCPADWTKRALSSARFDFPRLNKPGGWRGPPNSVVAQGLGGEVVVVALTLAEVEVKWWESCPWESGAARAFYLPRVPCLGFGVGVGLVLIQRGAVR